MSDIDTTKIAGEFNDRVKLVSFLTPGDLVVLWEAFQTVCPQFDPGSSTSRLVTNLVGFWKQMLDKAIQAAESGEYPPEFTITFCRGDFFLIVLVLDELLGWDRDDSDTFAERTREVVVELRHFFFERLHDPDREQDIGAPYRRIEAVLNDCALGTRRLRRTTKYAPS